MLDTCHSECPARTVETRPTREILPRYSADHVYIDDVVVDAYYFVNSQDVTTKLEGEQFCIIFSTDTEDDITANKCYKI